MTAAPPASAADHGEIPGASGSDFIAPSRAEKKETQKTAKPGERRLEDRRKSVDQYFGEDRRTGDRRYYSSPEKKSDEKDSGYHLRSKSETLYPTAFIPVSKEFYNELSKEQQDQLMKLQAIAQEKAGFEKGSPKFFIRDFDPGGGSEGSYVAPGEAADPVSDAAPRLVVGGALIGAGLLATVLVFTGFLPAGIVLAAGLVATGGGGAMVFLGR